MYGQATSGFGSVAACLGFYGFKDSRLRDLGIEGLGIGVLGIGDLGFRVGILGFGFWVWR